MFVCTLPVLVLMLGAAFLGGFVAYAYLKKILDKNRARIRDAQMINVNLESDYKKADLNNYNLQLEKERLLNHTRSQHVKIQHLNVQLQDLLYDHENKIKELDTIKTDILEIGSSDSTSTYVHFQSEFNALQEKHSDLKAILEEKNALIIQLKNEKDAFEARLTQSTELTNSDDKNLPNNKLSDNYRILKIDHSNLKTKYESIFKDLTEYKSRYQNYVKDYHEMRVKANKLEEVKLKMEAVQKGSNVSATELLRLRDENSNLRTQLAALNTPAQSSDEENLEKQRSEHPQPKTHPMRDTPQPKKKKATSKKTTDDLKAINGIDQEMEETLNSLGYTQYEQISKLNDDEMAIVNVALELDNDQILAENWIEQAKKLISKKKSRAF